MKAKKGSALLIVLGMLAFMIVSAVAFAAYMRYSRLPSSFLRRTSSSRQLVKAALARAIDQVDSAIGNNPHPGVGELKTLYPRSISSNNKKNSSSSSEEYRNLWLHRIFFGNFTQDDDNQVVDASDTVPVLTLEGLAYIPPPLVNEARYLSRRTPTAMWQSLDFDSGRFAYCAIDVSDYFDINRMFANKPRSSAANSRITLSYLFEDSDHGSFNETNADAWDTWMKKFRNFNEKNYVFDWSGKFPLISLADFNLALNDNGKVGPFTSPFAKFIGGANEFYKNALASGGKGKNSGEAGLDLIRSMTFVTDGLFPETTTNDYDLAIAENQPFEADYYRNKPSLYELIGDKSDIKQDWRDCLGALGCAILYDYLDGDRVPISLAIPTLEKVPMICGLSPHFDTPPELALKVSADEVQTNSEEGKTRLATQVVKYSIDPDKLLPTGYVDYLLAYPFTHEASEDFSIDGKLSLFFTTSQMGLRQSGCDLLATKDVKFDDTGLVAASGIMNIKLAEATGIKVPFKTKIEGPEDAVKEGSLDFVNIQELKRNLAENPLIEVTFQWTQTKVGESGTWTPADYKGAIQNQNACNLGVVEKFNIGALTGDGEVDPDIDVGKESPQLVSKNLALNAAVTLRIKNSEGAVVDMVPATLNDDKIQKVNEGDSSRLRNAFIAGKDFPIMRFSTAGSLKTPANLEELLALEDPASSSVAAITPKSVLVADPRFNWAPEHWFASANDLSVNDWTDAVGFDDIFLNTSDAEYLQSKWELLMLTQVSNDLANSAKNAASGYDFGETNGDLDIPEGRTEFASAKADAVNASKMWRSYSINYDSTQGKEVIDAIENLRWFSGKGFKVNPYSDSTNIVLAAFANTPVDWYNASTNIDNYASLKASDAIAWNEIDAPAHANFPWKSTEAIARKFVETMRSSANGWEQAYDRLGWDEADFLGVVPDSDVTLWDADRKFLFGYWRECFAAKQQLFLVFVRAEPLMMGGGAMGQVPPQLGARAVALVWRDPTAGKNDDSPHQTRILFYHQLD